jgi:hypothetical protein
VCRIRTNDPGLVWEWGSSARREPTVGPELPEWPHSRSLTSVRIWLDFKQLRFIWEGREAPYTQVSSILLVRKVPPFWGTLSVRCHPLLSIRNSTTEWPPNTLEKFHHLFKLVENFQLLHAQSMWGRAFMLCPWHWAPHTMTHYCRGNPCLEAIGSTAVVIIYNM